VKIGKNWSKNGRKNGGTMNEIKHTNISCVKEEKQCEDSNSGLSHRCFLAGAADMFYEELKQIIGYVLQQGLSGQPSISFIKTQNS
jgi:hypothetical protein